MTKPVTLLPDPKERKKCKHKECHSNAIFLEDYCWKHLPDKAKSRYKDKFIKWIDDGITVGEIDLVKSNPLEDTNFTDVDLSGTDLSDIDFQGANLRGANLQRADLSGANLQKAILIGANLKDVDFSGAELREAYMSGVLLNGASNLSWDYIEKVGHETSGKWYHLYDAQDAYRRLKNYFHQQGQYGDESKAYYREKLMAKHEAHEELFGWRRRVSFITARKSWRRFYVWFVRGVKRTFQNIGRFFAHNEIKGVRRRWLGLWFLWALAGFGEKWIRTISWAVGTFVFFGLLHWLGTNAGWWTLLTQTSRNTIIATKHLLNCLYFSLVTFVTLGFGDIWPDAWVAKILVGAEVVLGYVFLGIIVVLIARKFGR
ncbi:MAG: pentapeptide repeat-containing protein [candidate division WOR-3 bacterium]|nr:pentapeptide repeat-containing protein [candidate division WOR-3 bacterium]